MIGQKNALMAVVQSVAEPLKSSSEDPSTPLLHHMDGRAHGPSAPPLTLRPLLPLLLLLLLLLSPRSMMAPRSGVAIASALLLRSTSVLAFHSFAGPFSPAAGVGVQQRRWVASKGGGTDAGKRRGALSMAGPSKGRRRARPKSYALQQSSSDADEGLSASAGGTAVLDGDMADKGVMPVELTSELGSSFMQYAMSIILGRALPDARDGLKPVHRRILYAMHGLGLQPDSSYRKCARVVGEVLGKYHPHGDVAVYDALVRMSQDFVMGTPLVSGHGNFGSIDNDPPAAMRYTEAKLAPMARDGLLLDIALDTVDFVPNFDGNEEEPVVLPARVPMLLLNGATGIAVGMATNVPPHNLGELIAATARLIKDPQTSDNELFRLVPAPDFPTGGSIMGLAGARKMYTTSNGGITIRATTRIEAMGKGGQRSAIIVTEMPYMVNKAGLLEKIAAMVNDKKLEGISDLRDESDRDGIRVVIELKRDAVPQVVLNNLYQKTQLQTQFSANLLALGGGGTQPQRFTLRGALQAFIDFRFETLRRRTSFELSKVTARDHIVQGMLLALSKIDSVIEVVRGAKSSAEAREALMGDAYGLSHEQAEAILGLRLGRLTAMEEEKLKREHEDLTAEIARLGKLMQDDGATNELMISELEEIKRKHAVPRRTILKPDEGDLNEMDLLANESSIIVVTQAGYIKRMPLSIFDAQSRGTRGKAGAKMAGEDDGVVHFLTCRDHDTLLVISSRGVAYGLRAYQVPAASRTARGVPVPQVVPLSSDDGISSVIPVESFPDDEYLVLLSQKGYIKKTSLAAFEHLTARGLTITSLGEGDELLKVKRCTDKDSVMVATRKGHAIRFSTSQSKLRATGRTSRGVTAMKYRDGDEPVDMEILPGSDQEALPEGKFMVVVTENGYGKRVNANEFRLQGRGGLGVIATKFKRSSNDAVAAMRLVSEGDDIILSTAHGTIVRQPSSAISDQGRAATGVLVQRLDDGDTIRRMTLVPEDLALSTQSDEEAE